MRNCSLDVDLARFPSPCIKTGAELRPDMLLSVGKATFYIIALTVGFEANLNINADGKQEKYHQLTRDLSSDLHNFKFIKISLRTLGI